METRVAPAKPPFSPEIQQRLDQIMPQGVSPLVLLTTLARDPRLFERFVAGGLLDKGHLSLRQREIVIDRVTALCGSEYEWGVHISFFASRAGLTEEQIASTVKGGASDPFWTEEERVLLKACNELHETCDLNDHTWNALRQFLSEEALLEVLLLNGFYRTVSYLTNALRLPCEPFARRFPA